jgi:hypothetical protein
MPTYHRRESTTQTAETTRRQEASGEIWGYPDRRSPEVARVRAYKGPLPPEARGVQFDSDCPPDPGGTRSQASWTPRGADLILEDGIAKLRVTNFVNRQEARSPDPKTEIDWGKSVPIATIGLSPEELSSASSVAFRVDHDGLDDTLEATFCSVGGRRLGLVRHVGDPEPGTKLYAETAALRDGRDRVIEDALSTLRLDPEKITWRAPREVELEVDRVGS